MPEPKPESVMVPREPTQEMIDASKGALDAWRRSLDADEKMLRHTFRNGRGFHSATEDEKVVIRWKAMLASAPSSPAVEGELVKRLAKAADDLNELHIIKLPGFIALLREAAAAIQSRAAVEAETIEKCAKETELSFQEQGYIRTELSDRLRSLLPTATTGENP